MKHIHFIKKTTAVLLALCVMLAGCSKEAESSVSDSASPEAETQEVSPSEVIVADHGDVGEETNDARLIQVMDDTIYTASWSYDYDTMRQTDCRVSCQKNGGEAEVTAEFEEKLISFMVGADGAVYYLYEEDSGDGESCYLRKDAPGGGTEYCREVEADAPEGEEYGSLKSGAVSSQGELCFVSVEGSICLFDGEGDCLGWVEHNHDTWNQSCKEEKAGVVNYGGEIYLYELSEENRVSLWPLDFQEGAVGGKEYLITEKPAAAVFSGYENGLYLSDGESLWNYPPENTGGTAVLDWNDSNVSLQADFVEQIGVLDGGGLFVLYWDTFTDKYGQAVIQEKDASEVAARQRVTLGIQGSGFIKEEVEDTVKIFNKSSQDYQVELLVYDDYSEFYEDLLKGEGADLFELGSQSIQMLAGKGILEDLGPWFEQSESLEEEALLPRIREVGSVGDKLVCVFPNFYVHTLLTEEGATEAGGWTTDAFLELGRANPESKLTEYDESPVNLLLNYLCVQIGNYVDWENRECHFDDGSFTALLESLKANSQKKYAGEIYETEAESLFYKEMLTLHEAVASVEGYLLIKEAFAGFGEIAGYPNAEGKPWYRMNMNEIYGMNSSAKCKDGAWAFLEFLLSGEYQAKTVNFPVMQEALEKRLEEKAVELAGANVKYVNYYTQERKEAYPEFTEEDKEFIRYMAENAYWDNSMQVRDIQEIILEEVPYYFEGDKSAQEVAGTIQNRIGLYLKE